MLRNTNTCIGLFKPETEAYPGFLKTSKMESFATIAAENR